MEEEYMVSINFENEAENKGRSQSMDAGVKEILDRLDLKVASINWEALEKGAQSPVIDNDIKEALQAIYTLRSYLIAYLSS